MNIIPLPRRLRVLLRVGAFRSILHLLSSQPKVEKWVFVTGCYNSGTTLLARILAMDSRFNSLPGEGVRYTAELTRPEDIGWSRMWAKCIDYVKLPPLEQLTKASGMRKDWALFYSQGGAINIEKSITTIPRIRWFNANFENAFFIGIVRDPYAVAKGIQKKARPNPELGNNIPAIYSMEMAAEQWVVANTILLSETKDLENYYLTSYESLICEPIQTLNRIYDAINVSPPKMSFNGEDLIVDGQSIKLSVSDNHERVSNLSSEDVDSVFSVVSKSNIASTFSSIGLSEYKRPDPVSGCDNKVLPSHSR